ncbi:MAG: hypothetical protein ILP16_05090 [Spirochaetales bacterium]|nr:hypothetical protein [Spirochaetales bacterium]
MRKLFVLLIVVLTVFTLASCKNEPAPEHVHSWSDVETTKQPTCTTDGVRTYKCSCGETKTESIPKLGHSHNEFGLCLTCGDYKGTAMNKYGDYNFTLTNVTLKTGKNYFSIAVDEDVDLEELDFYKTYTPDPYTYPTNIKKVDLYDSIRLQTLEKAGNSYPAEPILGTDGERTVYLVVECDADDTIALMCFIS